MSLDIEVWDGKYETVEEMKLAWQADVLRQRFQKLLCQQRFRSSTNSLAPINFDIRVSDDTRNGAMCKLCKQLIFGSRAGGYKQLYEGMRDHRCDDEEAC